MNYFILFFFICTFHSCLLIRNTSNSLSCLDDNGKPVDWFILYKLPQKKKGRAKKGEPKKIPSGTNYMYMTSNTAHEGWTLSKELISSDESSPGHTLHQLFNGQVNDLWVLYNDQPPGDKDKTSRGHTKGVVAANQKGGFWLVHSVPHFPPLPDAGKYSYPASGHKNGQNLLCMTFPQSEMNKIGIQLQFNQVYTYWNHIPDKLATKYPELVKVASGKKFRIESFHNLVTLTTVGRNIFQSFAKSGEYDEDLYESFVAPELKSNLYVETWRNGGGGILPTNCTSKFSVMNVDEVKLCQVNQCDVFGYTQDHSKWAVTTSKQKSTTCIGDINRVGSQEKRGGGTVCFRNQGVWEAYFNSVASLEPCPRN